MSPVPLGSVSGVSHPTVVRVFSARHRQVLTSFPLRRFMLP